MPDAGPGGVRMRSRVRFSGPEGIIAADTIFYTGFRQDLKDKEMYHRLSHVNPEIRARFLERNSRAVREPLPGDSPLPGQPEENKRETPSEVKSQGPTLTMNHECPVCGEHLPSAGALRTHRQTHLAEENPKP